MAATPDQIYEFVVKLDLKVDSVPIPTITVNTPKTSGLLKETRQVNPGTVAKVQLPALKNPPPFLFIIPQGDLSEDTDLRYSFTETDTNTNRKPLTGAQAFFNGSTAWLWGTAAQDFIYFTAAKQVTVLVVMGFEPDPPALPAGGTTSGTRSTVSMGS